MRKFYFLCIAFTFAIINSTYGQVTLSGTSYTETFDGIASGLPLGWSVSTGATATSLGTATSITTAPAAWNSTSGGFKNFASADGLTSAASSTDQNSSTDRALGIRQTSKLGDPGGAFILQLANTSGFRNFTLNFKLQSLDTSSPRTTTWQVDYGLGATPATFTMAAATGTLTTGGSTFSNNTININFGNTLDDQNQPVWIRIVTLSSSTGSGNRPSSAIDDFQLSYNTSGGDVTPPSIASLSPANHATDIAANNTATIMFSETIQKGSGNIYIKKASDGTIVQTLNVTDPSVTVNTNTVSFPVTSLMANTAYYVEISAGAFKDLSNNDFAGISGSSTWTFTTGNALYAINFSNCTGALSDGFTQQSVVGAQVWSCSTFGHNGNGVEMDGYAGGNQANEDWLISPAIDLSGTNFPLLSFYSSTKFAGEPLKLYVTTNYTGDVTTTTWTEINGRFPAINSGTWTLSDNIDLSAFKGSNVRFAFKYISTTSAAPRWDIDDITILNSATPPLPSLTINGSMLFDFRDMIAGNSSTSKNFSFSANNFTTDLTVTTTSGFEVSKDNSSFGSSITYTASEIQNQQPTVYVRFKPTATNTVYVGYVKFSATGVSAIQPFFKG